MGFKKGDNAAYVRGGHGRAVHRCITIARDCAEDFIPGAPIWTVFLPRLEKYARPSAPFAGSDRDNVGLIVACRIGRGDVAIKCEIACTRNKQYATFFVLLNRVVHPL